MTKIRNRAILDKFGLWKTALIDKIRQVKKNSDEIDINNRDMSSHTLFSREDNTVDQALAGLTREEAKAKIERLVDEKLEKLSSLELSEQKIDFREKERQKALVAERINARRNRRKEKTKKKAETVFTEQGIYADYKASSVFDLLEPEPFPFEEEQTYPLDGQVSISEVLEIPQHQSEVLETPQPQNRAPETEITETAARNTTETAAKSAAEGMAEYPEKTRAVSYAIDIAIDRVFDFLGTAKSLLDKGLFVCRRKYELKVAPKIHAGIQKADQILHLTQTVRAVKVILSERESRLADQAAALIYFLDSKIEQLIKITKQGSIQFLAVFDRLVEYIEKNKKRLLIESGAVAAAITLVMLFIGSLTAYEYIYNGKVLGVVKNQEDVYKTIDIIGDKLSHEYDAEITIDKERDITFHKVYAFHSELDNKEDILNRLTYMRNMKANGHGIYVDGKLTAILDSEESAKQVLKVIQSRFLQNGTGIEYESIGFAENIKIKDVETKLGAIQKQESALEYMLTGATEKKIHVVQAGETFSEIAKMYGLKQSELRNSNPDVIPEKLKISQEICLTQIVPVVTVQTKEVATYSEVIPFEIAYENTATLYKNEQTVKSRGKNGERTVVAEIVRNNGIEVSRTELSSNILSQPASQVVLVGTKEPPPLVGTGSFIYPIRGTLTSRYGTRWGRMHTGIDLAAPIGTKIKAADGGKVTFAGYNGSLGYCIKIDHGGNRETLYGHCSKLFVKVGDRVYQGQHIANVGNTGRSTGPHVHFEVHINGRTKNPLNYL